MSCVNPFSIYVDYSKYGYYSYNSLSGTFSTYKEFQVPCGWCLNCRKDRQNYFADRAKYEYQKRLTGSFITFTYDDEHLYSECVPDLPNYCDNLPITTLQYEHLQKFIGRLRKYIQRHPELQNVLCQPDFSYMYVGEYGDFDNTHRPHFHLLCFGLDFAYCKKFIMDEWKKGLIDVLPILNGGIEYVTKYMDKQLFGEFAKIEYDNNGIARPKLRCSQNFGKGLLNDNRQDIINNNYTYKVEKNKRRPISQYWKKLLFKSLYDETDYKKQRLQIIDKMKHTYNLKDFSKKARDSFRQHQTELKETLLRERIRSSGKPAIDYRFYFQDLYGSVKWKRDILQLPTEEIRGLTFNYIDTIKEALCS